MKKAFITGITGQDGSYLAELLLSKGYEVHGAVRRVAIENPHQRFWRINNILDKIHLHEVSVENYGSVYNTVSKILPDECYHLAAQSFVADSFKDPFTTMEININGTLNVLEALRNLCPKCHFYFAASSEMFGKARETPQNENTPFHPRSPYGISKVAGFDLTRNYRESYNMFACSGVLFNHESSRRGFEFVTRKITSTLAKILCGEEKELRLGNLEAKRDWGHSMDYVTAMYMMLQHNNPMDFVISTGETYSIKDFLEVAFGHVGLSWEDYVVVDPRFYRPADVELLVGNSALAKKELGWYPDVLFDELVIDMVRNDINLLETV